MIIRFLWPLIITMLGASFLSVLIKKSFVKCLPIYFICLTLFLYLLTFINLFDIGYYIIVILSLGFIPYLLFNKYKNNKKIIPILKGIISPGVIIFLLLYIFLFILNYNRGFNTWDEFSHWGTMIKEMFTLKEFYNSSNSVLLVHRDYPPIITIFETFWCMLSGGYNEGCIFFGLQLLSFSFILSFFDKMKFNKWYNSILEIMAIFILLILAPFLVTVGEASFYSTIYTDPIVGILLCYGFSLIFFEKNSKFQISNLTILFTFMILTKQVCLVFYMLLIGTLILKWLVNNFKKWKKIIKRDYKKLLLSIGILIIVPMIFNFTWKYQVEKTNSESQFSISDISVKEFYEIYKNNNGESYKITTFNNFIKAIKYGEVQFITISSISFNYWQVMIFVSVLLYLVYLLFKKMYLKQDIITMILCINIGAIGYALALLLLYIFCFGSYEGPNLACIERYVNTYWFGIILFILLLFINGYQKEKKGKYSKLYLLIGVLILFWIVPTNLIKLERTKEYKTTAFQVYPDIQILNKYVDGDDSIFLVAQNTVALQNHMLQYSLVPNRVSMQYYSVGEKYNDGDVWTQNIEPEVWINYIFDNNYNYVYIYNCDEQFNKKYGKYFNRDIVVNKQLYKVDKENKILILRNGE